MEEQARTKGCEITVAVKILCPVCVGERRTEREREKEHESDKRRKSLDKWRARARLSV